MHIPPRKQNVNIPFFGEQVIEVRYNNARLLMQLHPREKTFFKEI
jgi:hypothetical protein